MTKNLYVLLVGLCLSPSNSALANRCDSLVARLDAVVEADEDLRQILRDFEDPASAASYLKMSDVLPRGELTRAEAAHLVFLAEVWQAHRPLGSMYNRDVAQAEFYLAAAERSLDPAWLPLLTKWSEDWSDGSSHFASLRARVEKVRESTLAAHPTNELSFVSPIDRVAPQYSQLRTDLLRLDPLLPNHRELLTMFASPDPGYRIQALKNFFERSDLWQLWSELSEPTRRLFFFRVRKLLAIEVPSRFDIAELYYLLRIGISTQGRRWVGVYNLVVTRWHNGEQDWQRELVHLGEIALRDTSVMSPVERTLRATSYDALREWSNAAFERQRLVRAALSDASPEVRRNALDDIHWRDLSLSQRRDFLNRAQTLIVAGPTSRSAKGFEIEAYIRLAKHSDDDRWIKVLNQWVEAWAKPQYRWEGQYKRNANEAIDHLNFISKQLGSDVEAEHRIHFANLDQLSERVRELTHDGKIYFSAYSRDMMVERGISEGDVMGFLADEEGRIVRVHDFQAEYGNLVFRWRSGEHRVIFSVTERDGEVSGVEVITTYQAEAAITRDPFAGDE